MLTCLCRENAEIRIRSAVTKDGEIVGREAVVLMDCGAYGGEQIFLTTMTAHTLRRQLPTWRGAAGQPRGLHQYRAQWRLPRLQRRLQHLRARTAHRRDLRPHRHGSSGVPPPQRVWATAISARPGKSSRATSSGRCSIGWSELRSASPSRKPLAGDRLYGRATAVGTWFVFVGPSAATVHLNADGSATLVTSGVEIGSGSMMQSLPQIVADELGLRPEDVIVRAADTDAAGYDVGVGGGSATVSLGAASRRRLRAKCAGSCSTSPREMLRRRSGRSGVARTAGSRSPGLKGRAQRSRASPSARRRLRVRSRGAARSRTRRRAARCPAARRTFHRSAGYPRLRRPRLRGGGRSGDRARRGPQLYASCRTSAGRSIRAPSRAKCRAASCRAWVTPCTRRSRSTRKGRIRQKGFETYRVPLAQDVVPVEISLL